MLISFCRGNQMQLSLSLNVEPLVTISSKYHYLYGMENDKELYAAYFGRSADYYLDVLERFRNGQRFVFNWYSLLLGLFWFLYRKMYRETIMFFTISVMLGMVQTLMFRDPSMAVYQQKINFMATILLNLSYGIFGNYLYIRKAIAEVEYAKTQSPDPVELTNYLSQKGGTTMHPVFILIIIYLLYIVLLKQLA